MPETNSPDQPPRKLEDLMAEKSGILSPSDSTSKAGAKMRQLNVDMLPVSEGRRLVGVLDERNPDHIAAGHGHDPTTTQIREGMKRDAVYCFEDQNVSEALAIMDEGKVDTLPVVDRELRIIGMVKRADLATKDAPTAE